MTRLRSETDLFVLNGTRRTTEIFADRGKCFQIGGSLMTSRRIERTIRWRLISLITRDDRREELISLRFDRIKFSFEKKSILTRGSSENGSHDDTRGSPAVATVFSRLILRCSGLFSLSSLLCIDATDLISDFAIDVVRCCSLTGFQQSSWSFTLNTPRTIQGNQCWFHDTFDTFRHV